MNKLIIQATATRIESELTLNDEKCIESLLRIANPNPIGVDFHSDIA